MKKLAIIFSFLLAASFSSFAQDQYIEVVVKDTLMVEPQRWILFINIEKQYDYAIPDTVAIADTIPGWRSTIGKNPKLKEGISADELKALVKKLNGRVLDDVSSLQYRIGRKSYESDNTNYFSAEFSNRKSMEDFSRAAMKNSDVNITVTGTFHSEVDRFKGLLDAKLINIARQRATHLAELSGRKAGNIILVSEATASESNTVQDLIETIIKYDGAESRRMAMMNLFPDKIKLEKALKVRFALQ